MSCLGTEAEDKIVHITTLIVREMLHSQHALYLYVPVARTKLLSFLKTYEEEICGTVAELSWHDQSSDQRKTGLLSPKPEK
jgi:hypothetical protein